MRFMVPILALATLAGCSSSPQAGNDAAGNAATATLAPTPVVVAKPAGTPLPDTGTSPKPGVLKTFGDWTVGCDNGNRCTLASLGPESGDFPAADLALQREADPSGPITISLQPLDSGDKPVTPVAIAIDGTKSAAFAKGADGVATLSGDAATTIARQMANGHALAILGGDGAVLATLSLDGASAALRYIDAQQGRAGGVTTIIARGSNPAADVPPPPALPQIVAVVPIGAPPRVDKATLDALRKTARCDEQSAASGCRYQRARTALRRWCWCRAARAPTTCRRRCSCATKEASSRRRGLTRPRASAATRTVPMVVNGAFKDGVLTSDTLARGLGDCGVKQQFVWDGNEFRLSGQSEMGECRGNPHYITTWRAVVGRR